MIFFSQPIFDRTMTEVGDDVAKHIDFESVVSAMKRARLVNVPKMPTKIGKLGQKLENGDYSETFQKNFIAQASLTIKGQQHCAIAIGDRRVINLVGGSFRELYCDGTFHA